MVLWVYCVSKIRVLHKIKIFVFDVRRLDISSFSPRLFVYCANLSSALLKNQALFCPFPRQDFIYNHFVYFSFNCNHIFPFNLLFEQSIRGEDFYEYRVYLWRRVNS